MIGFSVPPFFSGVLVIVIFSVQLGWFPSIYDTMHVVDDWASFKVQFGRCFCLSWFWLCRSQPNQPLHARFDARQLSHDYVRTARAKGLSEATWCWFMFCAIR